MLCSPVACAPPSARLRRAFNKEKTIAIQNGAKASHGAAPLLHIPTLPLLRVIVALCHHGDEGSGNIFFLHYK